jgi:hypothetical protein
MPLAQRLGRAGARQHPRAAVPLQRGHSADMVEMLVRHQDQLHLAHVMAGRLEIGLDQRRRLRQVAIDQDHPVFGRDHHRREAGHPDIPAAAMQVDRRLGLVPAGAVAAVERHRQRIGQTRRGQHGHCPCGESFFHVSFPHR